ncbi:BZ3500_MvSof-1268-A1-R1_Chr1-1g01105 [Microbotryum saponariae]|uniref:BZ3500_MvSof-1268-A1-R1_Chr1-1g01105 protein n=1 Tax=Microbotryum saponariae TaxID=289078 RepID=A0A2X0MGT9_9BASI|nr:BZ3500_MvSof-1268-A1-R1_Chr1-1g01105 [Microbotryum saponariae]SCZ93390.1 BZ3501_MvSof-1269-A2-R1_Chr1-1g00702 [Microbotryum saponariae]
MAGLLIYGATYLVVKAVDTVKTRRSPVVPTPPLSDPATYHYGGDSNLGTSLLVTEVESVPRQRGTKREMKQRPFTERQLKAGLTCRRVIYDRHAELYRSWKYRDDMLLSKQNGLEYAIAHGWDVCWAGRTSEFSTVRRARSESRFVVDQLALAIAWCRSQQVPKTSLVSTLEPRSKIRRQTRSAHSSCPPSLLELPWPIPEPPGEREYGSVIERAPRFTREGPEALPLYSPAVDQERGERRLEFTPIAEGERWRA